MHGDLERIFDFDADDLSLNQNGQTSEKQVQLISEYRRVRRFGGRVAIGCFSASIFSITVVPFYSMGIEQLRKYPEIVISYAAVFLLASALFIFSVLLGNLRSDLKSGKISVVEGIAEKWEKKVSRNLGTAYYLKIGNEKFQLDEKAKYEVFQPNVGYRIFYVKHPPTHIILSISEISDFR